MEFQLKIVPDGPTLLIGQTALCYIFIENVYKPIVIPFVKDRCQKSHKYENLKPYQKADAIEKFNLSIHHFLGALLIALGFVRVGLLLEIVVELTDLVNLVLGREQFATMPRKLKMVTIAHHGFGLLNFIPLMYYGFDEDTRVTMITMSLMASGSVELFCMGAKKTFDEGSPIRLIGFSLSVIVILLTRFMIFPTHLFDLLSDKSFNTFALQASGIVGGLLMSAFSIVILKAMIEHWFKEVESFKALKAKMN